MRCAATLLLTAAVLTDAATAASVRVTVLNPAGTLLSDAVVMLESTTGRTAPRPLASAEVGQQDKRFQPQVAVVPVGTRVDFPNRDTVRHHVYSVSESKRFEIKLYVGRPEKPVLFDKPGVVVLGCNIHDSMIGWIVVADTPWYGRSGPDGVVQIADVPPGSYRLRTWHPVLPAGSMGVEQPLAVAGDTEMSVRLTGAAR
ncbi:methylamine utilization protein [Ideonella sp. 4Y16]|uniref:Methylamine utilization protein n=1 Tax=Ideonella alba TaxID=2824118 RepID=A0A940YE23_9BURK|nr:methylamine utilization protein [Ideonella alba]MBQ0933411.1 methylamine utilization protein [Ideonella alba]MBQ0943544.1 methylamine utilization protein [Ideonella alba]